MQGAFGAHGFGTGEFFQPLHARLGLPGLGGLGLEAVDEGLQVGALDLFLLVRDLLLAKVLGTLALEAGVIADIKLRTAVVQMKDVACHAVEELAVVADQHQHAGVFQQPLLQPQHRVQVEVVGGLVEQQQVAGRHQRARQIEPGAPAAGKSGHRARMGFRREAQPVQQPSCTRRGVVTAQVAQALVRCGHGFVILARGGIRLFAQRLRHRGIAADHEIERSVGQRRGFLRHRGDAQACRKVELADVRLQLAQERSEQAGLAAAVASDHAHPPAGVQGQVHLRKQQARTTAQREVAEGDHCGTRRGARPEGGAF